MRGTYHPKMEQALYKWYVEQCEHNVEVSTAMLRNQAQIFYNEFRESNYSFSASTGWTKNFKKRFGIERLSGDKSKQFDQYKQGTVLNGFVSDDGGDDGDAKCESYEYLIETHTDCEDEHFPQQITIKPAVAETTDMLIEERIIDDTEAYDCLETVIKWSMQRGIDTLYLTMLRNLKSKARNGKK